MERIPEYNTNLNKGCRELQMIAQIAIDPSPWEKEQWFLNKVKEFNLDNIEEC